MIYNFFAVCRLLEQEKTDHRDLKETWRKANEEFLEQQTMLCWEIENMRDLMTPAQNEKLSRRYRLKHSAPAKSKQAKTIKTVAEEPYSVGNVNDDLIKFDDSPKKGQVPMPKPVTPSDVHLSEVGNAMWLLTNYEINAEKMFGSNIFLSASSSSLIKASTYGRIFSKCRASQKKFSFLKIRSTKSTSQI